MTAEKDAPVPRKNMLSRFLSAIERIGNALPAGTLTARTCTQLTVSVEREAALDVTMLPPGLPRE